MDQVAGLMAVELTVVIPTFNERENVRPLIERLDAALLGIAWEAVFVDDDSSDGTAALLRDMAHRDPRIRCIQRIGRRGLSSAVVEGMLASSTPYLAVIDADLQHDETLLPAMLARIKADRLDVVVGSRYAGQGGTGDWGRGRVAISGVASRLARLVVTHDLTDPMSGFFMLTRPAFERTVRRLSGQGFKILLDLFASTPAPYRFAELPYVFGLRQHGASKLDSAAVWDYLLLLADKMVGRFVPLRFVMFATVGAVGLAVHLTALGVALTALSFEAAQAVATVVAMTSNFIFNNMLTYRDQRLRGWRFLGGLLSFYLVCGIGAVANVGIAAAVFRDHYGWQVAGLAGAVIGVVWNYAASSVFTWRKAT